MLAVVAVAEVPVLVVVPLRLFFLALEAAPDVGPLAHTKQNLEWVQ